MPNGKRPVQVSYPTQYQGSHIFIDHNSMVVTAKSPNQPGTQQQQATQVLRPQAKQMMKTAQTQQNTNTLVIKNKQQAAATATIPTGGANSTPTSQSSGGQTGQTVRKIIRHDSTSSDTTGNATVQGQQQMKSALTTSPRPQTVLSPVSQANETLYQRATQAMPTMPIRAQMIGPKMNGGLIYYAAPNGLATGPGGGFLPYTQPIPLRTVHDNNNAFPKLATTHQGSTAYVHMIGNQPIVSQSSQQPQYVPTSAGTIQMITSTQPSSSPDMFTIKPSILNRKRPQQSVVVTQQQQHHQQPQMTTQQQQRENPPAKQAKLETPSTSSSPGLEQQQNNQVNIKVASKLKYETVIRSPQRNRRKQILETNIASPLRTSSPAISIATTNSTTIAPPDKAVDDVSTDDADEWENEHPKEMKLSFEESPTLPSSANTTTTSSNNDAAVPPYRKFLKHSNNQRRASLNAASLSHQQSESKDHHLHHHLHHQPKVARAHRTRQPSAKSTKSTSQSSATSTATTTPTPKKKSHRAQIGWERRESSSSMHFMCGDHVARLVGDVLDERPLRNRELKEQARSCIFKLNLLNRELSKCQTEQKVLSTRFSRQMNKARGVLIEI